MILIKNGLLIDPGNSRVGAFDVLLEGETVKDVAGRGQFSSVKNAVVIDASGAWVTPGLIDLHVHLREPGYEWKETIKSGAQAAALGGFTTVCCMANTQPVNDCAEISRFIIEKSAAAGAARVLPVGAVTLGQKGEEIAPFCEMLKAGCVAFSDDGHPVHNALIMRRALEWCRTLGVPVCCHEEERRLSAGGSMNESPRSIRMGLRGMPAVAEEGMIARDIELARTTGGRVHFCHVSTARSLELIRRAKADGIAVTAEAAPHHILLNEDWVEDYSTHAKMSPPLRTPGDCQALLEGLNDGTIDAIASDHAPHENDLKEIEFDKAAFGIIGLQTTLPLMLELVRREKLPHSRLVELLTSQAAAVLGLSNCGSLSKGARADVTIIRPESPWVFNRSSNKSLSYNSPWLDSEMNGKAETVIVGGKIVVQQGSLA